MSMPSPGLRISFWDHSCSPVAALSANAFELVAPYTVVPTTLTPSGPMFGELYALCQSSLPVLILIAHTPDPRSWKYATPPTITGVAAKAPKPTPSLPVIGTFQATPSLETLDDVMDDTTSRVPARLPLGCVQAAAAAAGAGGVGGEGGRGRRRCRRGRRARRRRGRRGRRRRRGFLGTAAATGEQPDGRDEREEHAPR